MSSDLNTNRYDRIIRRVGNMVGAGSRVSEVLSELFPVIDLERVPAELLLLGGTRTAMGGGALSATAAVAGKGQLFNPADSGMLITITDIWISCSSSVVIRWGRSNVSFAARISTETFTDSRNPVVNLPVGQIHQLNVAAFANATNQVRVLASDPLHISPRKAIAILSPGFGFEVGSGTVNVTVNYGFNWRERVAEQSELSV